MKGNLQYSQKKGENKPKLREPREKEMIAKPTITSKRRNLKSASLEIP